MLLSWPTLDRPTVSSPLELAVSTPDNVRSGSQGSDQLPPSKQMWTASGGSDPMDLSPRGKGKGDKKGKGKGKGDKSTKPKECFCG